MAWQIGGRVWCDANGNGRIDSEDTLLGGVVLTVENTAGTFSSNMVTWPDGSAFQGEYYLNMPSVADTYCITIDTTTLPAGSSIVIPAAGEYCFPLNDTTRSFTGDWLIDSPTCREEAKCWMTAGGVKFEPILNARTAEVKNGNGGGPSDSVGGVVYPGCSPFPGGGGNWNHVAHSLKLHLLGKDQTVIRCDNVDGHPPGTDSPVCTVDFIEWISTGVVQGIGGNKFGPVPVTYFGRIEDRNEPGNEQSATSGGDIDRYFLRVVDGNGNVLILIDADGVDNGVVDPLTITGGNFQIHCTSCD